MVTTTEQRTFTSAEVCQMAGLSYRQLDYWYRRNLLRPVRSRPGTGHAHVWTEVEAVKACEFARMLNAGLTWSKATELLTSGNTATLTVAPLPEVLPEP